MAQAVNAHLPPTSPLIPAPPGQQSAAVGSGVAAVVNKETRQIDLPTTKATSPLAHDRPEVKVYPPRTLVEADLATLLSANQQGKTVMLIDSENTSPTSTNQPAPTVNSSQLVSPLPVETSFLKQQMVKVVSQWPVFPPQQPAHDAAFADLHKALDSNSYDREKHFKAMDWKDKSVKDAFVNFCASEDLHVPYQQMFLVGLHPDAIQHAQRRLYDAAKKELNEQATPTALLAWVGNAPAHMIVRHLDLVHRKASRLGCPQVLFVTVVKYLENEARYSRLGAGRLSAIDVMDRFFKHVDFAKLGADPRELLRPINYKLRNVVLSDPDLLQCGGWNQVLLDTVKVLKKEDEQQ